MEHAIAGFIISLQKRNPKISKNEIWDQVEKRFGSHIMTFSLVNKVDKVLFKGHKGGFFTAAYGFPEKGDILRPSWGATLRVQSSGIFTFDAEQLSPKPEPRGEEWLEVD